MKLPPGWKVAVAIVAVLLLGGAGAVAWIASNKPVHLSLTSSRPNTTPPAASDPINAVCRRPAVPGNATSPGLAGLWAVGSGSVAGYRAREQFAGFSGPHEAVARTQRVGGWLLVSGGRTSANIVTGCIAVDVRTLVSIDQLPGFNTRDRDDIARDFLAASAHPYVVFEPYPMHVDADLTRDTAGRVQVPGDMEIRGVTHKAVFALDLRYGDGQFAAAGSATVLVTDFGVDVPQAADGFVAVNPNITLEVSLALSKP